MLIRDQINVRDDYEREEMEVQRVQAAPGRTLFTKIIKAENVVMGSQESICIFQSLETSRADHPFLKNLRERLELWLTCNLPHYDCPLPPSGQVAFEPDETVIAACV